MEYITNLINNIDFAKEWIGLLASFVLVISFFFKDINKFRIVNSVAALIWIAFGIDIESIAVIITNLFIICLNLKHLFADLSKNKEVNKNL